MPDLLCCACAANPPSTSGLCSPCWSDTKAAQRAAQEAAEQARAAAAAAGRRRIPAYRVDRDVGHGLGTGRHCGEHGRRGRQRAQGRREATQTPPEVA